MTGLKDQKAQSKKTRSKKGGAVPIILIAVAAGAAGIGLIAASSTSMRLPTSTLVTPTNAEVERLLAASGVTPESLAASGVGQAGAQETVSDAKTYITNNYGSISTAEDNLRTARNDYDTLLRLVQSGLATQQQVGDLATARSTLDSAESTWQSRLGSIYDAAVADLSGDPDPKTMLATIKGNSDWSHPVQYRAADRTEAKWVELRDALSHVRICDKLGNEPDPAMEQVISTADANASVSAANTGLDNLALVQQGWDAGLSG